MSYTLEKPYTDIQYADFVVEHNHQNGRDIEITEDAVYALEANEMMSWQDVEEEIQVEIEPAEYETVEIPAVYDVVQVPVLDEIGSPVLDDEGNQTYREEQIEIEPARTEARLVKEAVYETQTVTVQRYVPVINPNYEAEQAQRERQRLDLLNLTAADVERAIYKAKGMDFEDVIKKVEELNGLMAEGLDENSPSTSQPITPSTRIDIKALKIELKANNFYRGNPYINVVGELLGFTSEQLDEFFETNDYTKLIAE